MFTPYDWQEGIGNRAQYVEGKLAQGTPVVGLSIPAGIVLFTYRRQARKIYEVYDRLVFAGVGQQSDVEALRVAAVDFAHQEGYNRSEEDVTIQRVATALSGPLKKAFADFGAAPLVARVLFAEANETPEDDAYYVLDYDGDYAIFRGSVALCGSEAQSQVFQERLSSLKGDRLGPAEAADALRDLWNSAMDQESTTVEDPTPDPIPEAVLLERNTEHENRFQSLLGGD